MKITIIFVLFLLIYIVESFLTYPKTPFYHDNITKYDLTVRKTSSGYVRGKKLITKKDVEGYVFLSLPIAEAPTGNLRFKKPIKRKSWIGILNVTEYTVSCYWNSTLTSYNPSDFIMNEDCLHVHIFTNKYCLENGGCSVNGYLHGGDLAYGTPLQFNNEMLIENFNNKSRNVVLVTINFRQAIFGTINLNWKYNLSMDMNPALHDIIHALEWIQTDIHVFGGDPKKLTLMGHSGGAALVKLITSSPKSKNMVRQMITMSPGTDRKLFRDKNERSSRYLAKYIGCVNYGVDDVKWQRINEIEKVLQCLRNKTAKEISDAQSAIEPEYIFVSVARDSGPDAILPDNYDDMLKRIEPIPYLAGTVSKEYLSSKSTVISGVYVDQIELRYWCKKTFKLAGYFTISNELILNCMREYNTTSKSMYVNDDVDIYVPTRLFCEEQMNKGANVYLYEFSYADIGQAYVRGENKPEFSRDESPHHSQELVYVIGQHKGNFTPKDDQIQYFFTKFFVDFINHGTPTTMDDPWLKLQSNIGNYFNIDFPESSLKSPGIKLGYHQDAYNFWQLYVPSVAGPTLMPYTEAEQIAIEKAESTAESEEYDDDYDYNDLGHSGLNWAIAFWIGMGIIALLAISHIITCCHFKTKKSDYQSI